MRCLYIVSQSPISANYRGGSGVVYYEQLAAIRDLGHEVVLWHYAYDTERAEFDEFVRNDGDCWQRVKAMCESIHLSTYSREPSVFTRILGRASNWRAVTPVRNPVLRVSAFRMLRRLIETEQPDFIWAQHFGPSQVALLQRDIPVVFSHHDWLYRIKALAAGRAQNRTMLDAEESVARRAQAVTSGSAIECEELKAIGCGNVHYLPASYEPVLLANAISATSRTRVVHLGGFRTTASRLGMQRFLEVVWPSVAAHDIELLVVGDLDGAPTELRNALACATCTGYQTDLSEVLQPYDIHVIPWEHATGQRTRLPLAFNHRQVVVATRAAVRCYPEAVDDYNCRLVDGLHEMAETILELAGDYGLRQRLGRAARETFEHRFVRKSLLPRYERAIRSAFGQKPNHGWSLPQAAPSGDRCHTDTFPEVGL